VITLDTSAILAILNRADENHALVVRVRNSERKPWYVPATVLAEIGYLVESELGFNALAGFLQDIMRGAYVLACGEPGLRRVHQLITRYRDLPLGYADAAVVACAEDHGGRVLTTDWRHFPTVAREGTITVVPPGPHSG
jgi:predicted nucleic acid-binding protein